MRLTSLRPGKKYFLFILVLASLDSLRCPAGANKFYSFKTINHKPSYETFPTDTTLGINQNYEADIKAKDIDSDAVTVELLNKPADMNLTNGKITWFVDRAKYNPSQQFTIKVRISDGVNVVDSSFHINLKPHSWTYLGKFDPLLITDMAGPSEDTMYRAGRFQDYLVIYKTIDKAKSWMPDPIYKSQAIVPQRIEYAANSMELFYSPMGMPGNGFKLINFTATPPAETLNTSFNKTGCAALSPVNGKVYIFFNGTGQDAGHVKISDPDFPTQIDLGVIGNSRDAASAKTSSAIFMLAGNGIYRKMGAILPDWRIANSGSFRAIKLGSDDGNTLFLIDDDNKLYSSTSGLSTIISIGSAISDSVASVEMVNANEGWFAKTDSTVFFTNNGFSTAKWQEQFLDDQKNKIKIFKVRASQNGKGVFALGGNGELFRY
jgi:hypothetical protein